MKVTPRAPHPWEEFLAARCNAIDWLRDEFGHSDEEVAHVLSMTPIQVMLIRTRDRTMDHTAADKSTPRAE